MKKEMLVSCGEIDYRMKKHHLWKLH